MNDTYCISYENNNKILVSVANKCGSSTCITIMGYPFLGQFRYRKDTKQLHRNNWQVTSISKMQSEVIKSYPVRVAIIRDPIERFVSCYKDRVCQRNKDNTRSKIPNFSYFLNNINVIRQESRDIKKHTESLVFSYGSDANLYTHIINTKNINTEFIPLIEKISGSAEIPVAFWKNSFAIKDVQVTEEEKTILKNMYALDYKTFKDFL